VANLSKMNTRQFCCILFCILRGAAILTAKHVEEHCYDHKWIELSLMKLKDSIWVLQLPIVYNQKIWSGAGLKLLCGWFAGFFATHIVQKLLITSLDGFLGPLFMQVKNERWWLMVIRCTCGTNRKLHDFNPPFFSQQRQKWWRCKQFVYQNMTVVRAEMKDCFKFESILWSMSETPQTLWHQFSSPCLSHSLRCGASSWFGLKLKCVQSADMNHQF